MKTVTAAILVLFLLSASLTGWQIFSQPDTYVIGGAYVVPASEVIHGDLRTLFAQVELAEGSRVDGKITAVSSTLDLAGDVSGSILAIGSDVTVRATAQLAEAPRRVTSIPYIVLLPNLLRTGNIATVQ